MSKIRGLNGTFKTLKAKDEHSTFESLYKEHYEKLCVFLLNYISDKDKIEDIVQDTFINFWSKRDKITITSSTKNYLYRSAYNKLIDSFREEKKKEDMISSYYNTAVLLADSLDDFQKELRLEKLNNCLEQLPTRCKEVFVSSKITGKKYQEIADDLEISLKTVEGHITKAYKLIKSCFALNKD